MALTPTITLTATVKAATATAVRLKERMTARAASRPTTPKTDAAGPPSRRIATTIAAGVKSAPPTTMQSSAANPNARLPPAPSKTKPSRFKASAPTVIAGSKRRVRSSSIERFMMPAGGVRVASQEGSAAARVLAATPMSAPFARVPGKTLMPVTLTLK